jgi:hypothetical protein
VQATVFSVSMRRGTCDVVLSVAMLSQHATWNERHMHMARRKRVMVPRHAHVAWWKTNRIPRCWLMVDAREGRLFVLLACCLVCDMQRRRMGIVRRKRDVTRRMIARCTMPHACCCQALPSGQGEGGACALLAGACRSVLLTRSPLAWPNKPGRHMHMIVNAPCSAQWLPAWSQIGRPPFSGVGQ